jgi:hypothetical protein
MLLTKLKKRILSLPVTTIFVFFLVGCSSERSFDIPRPAKLAKPARLFTKPDSGSLVIRDLQPNTIVYALAEIPNAPAKKASDTWIKVRTRSGLEGWCRARLTFCSAEEADNQIKNDRLLFETNLRDSILNAAKEKILSEKIHPLSSIKSIVVSSPITPQNVPAANYYADVVALMVGDFLGKIKHQVDVRVSLFVDLDKDLPANSRVEVQQVQIVSDKQTDGLSVQDTATLIKLMGLF